MQLPAASTLIQRCLDWMSALYGTVIFDEWAVVTVAPDGASLAAYEGPRSGEFRGRFISDVHALRALLAGRPMELGEFAFAPAAEGTAFDACVRIGPAAYLLLNHTSRTMDDIRSDPRWRQAQKPFVDLTEVFRGDPLA